MVRRFINKKYTDFALSIRRSQIHRSGLFADETIPARHLVVEYAGRRLTWRQVLERERKRRAKGAQTATYLFNVNRFTFIDGSEAGSGAEFANHSCDPNLSTIALKNRPFYFSRKRINAGEELTLDYHFAPDSDLIPCRCGSPKCRGRINEKSVRGIRSSRKKPLASKRNHAHRSKMTTHHVE
jgi:SET domain-containing protein